jgi:hypothetical protein
VLVVGRDERLKVPWMVFGVQHMQDATRVGAN